MAPELPGSALPSVSVVIPTTGRSSLRQAVESALAQVRVRTEVIVVDDRPPEVETTLELLLATDHRVKVIRTEGRQGAARARNLGVKEASSSWVAFLDDDDTWLPAKLAVQLAAADGRDDRCVISCRAVSVDARGRRSQPIPLVPYREGEELPRWLLYKRRISARRNAFFTPTLVISRSLLLEHPWAESLRRHQDWDLLIRLWSLGDVRFLQVADALVEVAVGSEGSISGGADWESSLDWILRAPLDDPTLVADFIAAQPLRYALQDRSWRGVVTTTRAVLRTKRPPSAVGLLLGLSGLASRKRFERAMSTGRRAG